MFNAKTTTFDLIKNFDSLNHKAILEALARDNCNMLSTGLSILERDKQSTAPQWMCDVITLLSNNQLIPGIKLTREKTGLGLKEAKDVCDYLRGNTEVTFSTNNAFVVNEFIDFGLCNAPKVNVMTLGELLKSKLDPKPAVQKYVYILRYSDSEGICGVFSKMDVAEREQAKCHSPEDMYVTTWEVDEYL